MGPEWNVSDVGEEGSFELNESNEIGDGMLGLTSKERLARILGELRRDGAGLFRDVDFPAEQASLFFSQREPREMAKVRVQKKANIGY